MTRKVTFNVSEHPATASVRPLAAVRWDGPEMTVLGTITAPCKRLDKFSANGASARRPLGAS